MLPNSIYFIFGFSFCIIELAKKLQLGYKRSSLLFSLLCVHKYNHVCALEGIQFNFHLFMPLHAVPVFSFCATLRLQSSAHVLITSIRPCVTLMLVCLYGQEVVSYASAAALYYMSFCARRAIESLCEIRVLRYRFIRPRVATN